MNSFAGQEKVISEALEGKSLKTWDIWIKPIEGTIRTKAYKGLIKVLVSVVDATQKGKVPELAFIVDPNNFEVRENYEDNTRFSIFLRDTLATELRRVVNEIVEAKTNKTFPRINLREFGDIEISPFKYLKLKARFRLLQSTEPNQVSYEVEITNIQTSCNKVTLASVISLDIDKGSDKITISITGQSDDVFMHESPMLNYIRNTVAKRLGERNYIKSPKTFKKDEAKHGGRLTLTYTYEPFKLLTI